MFVGNVQNMKPVQKCSGFIFCTFSMVVTFKCPNIYFDKFILWRYVSVAELSASHQSQNFGKIYIHTMYYQTILKDIKVIKF